MPGRSRNAGQSAKDRTESPDGISKNLTKVQRRFAYGLKSGELVGNNEIFGVGQNRGLRPALGSVRGPMLSFAELGPKASATVLKPTASRDKIAQGPTPDEAAMRTIMCDIIGTA
jgi:hypothetical protein